MASVVQFCLHLHPFVVYTSSEGSGKSTYIYAHARLGLHCSTLRRVLKSNGLAPLINSSEIVNLNSKSILFDLKYAKNSKAAILYQR